MDRNLGLEFIEAFPGSWVTGGLRQERYELFFPFGADKAKGPIERLWVEFQRRLRVKRKAPNELTVRFGSQWWALTWGTCKRVVEYLDSNPLVARFFRATYIPDEMVFPTIVSHLVPASQIAMHGLTKFEFRNTGHPKVYYDDCKLPSDSGNHFFIRKVSSEAGQLQAQCLNLAGEPASLQDRHSADAGFISLEDDMESNSEVSIPGRIFDRRQYIDRPYSVSNSISKPYIFVFGSPVRVEAILKNFESAYIKRFGRVFAEERCKPNYTSENLRQIGLIGTSISDLHPALQLARIRQRVDSVVAFGWSPGDSTKALEVVASDPNALCILSLHNDESLSQHPAIRNAAASGAPEDCALNAFRLFGNCESKFAFDQCVIDYGPRTSDAFARSKVPGRFSGYPWVEDILIGVR